VSKLRDVLRLTAAGMSSPAGGCEPHHRGDDGHRLSGAGAAGWTTAGRSDRRDAGASPL